MMNRSAYRWPVSTFILGVLELVIPYTRLQHIGSQNTLWEAIIIAVLSFFPILQILCSLLVFIQLSKGKLASPFFILWNAVFVILGIIVPLIYFLISGLLLLFVR